jgi:glutamyl-tRNA synthetase
MTKISGSKFEEKIYGYALKNAVEHEGRCQAGSVLSPLFAEGLEKEDVRIIMPKINEAVKKVNALSLDEQKSEFSEIEKKLSHRDVRDTNEMPELEDVPKTGVIMRFSPSSSASAFHIGHILTGMPSCLYVKKYGGKLYLRIEDTNPEKTVKECYESFPKEAEWIFGNVTEWYAQSDRMQKYYDFALELVKKGLAFVCTCKKEENEDKEEHKIREPCNCRNNSILENQTKWASMLDKKGFKEGEAILRFKSSDLKLANPALIDFPLARINLTKHPRQGNKYRVWPLMNLCVTFDDMEQKCTHIIRAKEHQDNAKRQEMIFEALKIKKPKTYFLGRYKFEDLPISKTQITELIKKGKFSGWDDIRLPLARNFKKRGYLPEAFAKMVAQRGLSEVDKVMAQKDLFQVLDNFNREIIKDRAILASWEEIKEKSKVKNFIEVLMPDASITRGLSDLDLKELKDESIVFLKGLGYCRFNKNEKTQFWFSHK